MRRWKPKGSSCAVALYAAIVAEVRDPAWYATGRVPDTFDGRFDMLAALLGLVLVRLEAEGSPGAVDAVHLTERFVSDMDGHVRERGIGDLLVGKHVGRMVAALGGRLDAYRGAMDDDAALTAALARNLWRGSPPAADRVAFVAARLRAFRDRLAGRDHDAIVSGDIA